MCKSFYVFVIVIFCGRASANLCQDINSTGFGLDQFLLKNVHLNSQFRNSSEFYLNANAKNIMSCCKECCKEEDCHSVFFDEGDCYHIRCSFLDNNSRPCPFDIVFLESPFYSNFTLVIIKEAVNASLEQILRHFQSKKAEISAMTGDSFHKEIIMSPVVQQVNEFKPIIESSISLPKTTMATVVPDIHLMTSTSQHPPFTTAIIWTVSAGKARVSHIPNNNLTLYALVEPEPSENDKDLYSYQWVMVSSPLSIGLGHMDNMSSPTLKLSMLHEGNYTLKVTVTRADQSNEAYVNVTVLPAVKKNIPPVAQITPSEQNLNQQNDLVLDGSESSDDDTIISFKWELISGPTFTFPIDTSFNSTVFKLKGPLTPGLYKFRLTVTDSSKATNHTDARVDVIKEIDYPPKANAGNNRIIQLPLNNITLMGNASHDDKGIISYEWAKISNNLVNDMTGARSPFLQLSNLQEGDYTFTLTVTDASNQVDKAEVHVIVKPAQNQQPLANAGTNQLLFLPLASVELDATNSTDDVGIVSYKWEILNGPDVPVLENADQSRARLLNPRVGVYVLQVKVTDEMGLQSTSKVSITVKQNQNVAPVSNAGGDIEVELSVELVVVLNGSLSYDDKGINKFLWTRNNKSPAAGAPIKNSEHFPVLQLVDLVKGQYVWILEVTDSEGLTNKSQMVLTVKGDSKEDFIVRLVLGVEAEMFTGLYKDALQSHLEDLVKKCFEVSEGRVTIRRVSRDPITGRSVIDFYAESHDKGVWILHVGDQVENVLKYELTTGFSNILEFPIITIFSVVCHRNCSGHGKCDQVTRKCICDSFWTANWFKMNFGSKETNCDWSILYVAIAIIVILIFMVFILWYVVYAINKRLKNQPIRSQGPAKKRHRYTLLDKTLNGFKSNGNASRDLYQDKELQYLKIRGDLSDSGSSSDEMIFLRPTNQHQLRTIRRNKSEKNKLLSSNISMKSLPDEEQDWSKSIQDDVID